MKRTLPALRWITPLAALLLLVLVAAPAIGQVLRPRYEGLAVARSWDTGQTWDAVSHGDALLLIAHRNQPLLLDNGEPVALPWGHGDRHQCAFGDVDGDGRDDIFCTHGAERGTSAEANELWLHEAVGWREAAAEWGVASPESRSRAAVLWDADGDGDLDLFVGTRARAGYPDTLYRNEGDRFTPTTTVDQDTKHALLAGEELVTSGGPLRWWSANLDLITEVAGDWNAIDYWDGLLTAIDSYGDVVIFDGQREVARYAIPGDAMDVAGTDFGLYVVVGDLAGETNPADILIHDGELYTVPIDMPGLGQSATAVPGGVVVGNGQLESEGGFLLLTQR